VEEDTAEDHIMARVRTEKLVQLKAADGIAVNIKVKVSVGSTRIRHILVYTEVKCVNTGLSKKISRFIVISILWVVG